MSQFNAGRAASEAVYRPKLTTKQFIWLIGSLCRVHGVPFDAVRLVQRFPAPHLREGLIDAVRAHGLRVEVLTPRGSELEALSLPAIAFLRPDMTQSLPAFRPEPIPGLIAKCDAGRLLHVEACTDLPRTRFTRNFEEFFESEVIVAAPERGSPH
jgi:subfamily B ATP-binding cassette protein HlyB/CyaB